MKWTISMAAFVFIVTLSACKKDNNDSDNFVRATIGTTSWSTDNVNFLSIGSTHKVTGSKGSSSYLEIELDQSASGTINLPSNMASVTYSDGSNTYSVNILGTINVSSNSTNLVQGSFNLTNVSSFAGDTLEFKNGAFKYSRD